MIVLIYIYICTVGITGICVYVMLTYNGEYLIVKMMPYESHDFHLYSLLIKLIDWTAI